MDECGTTVFPLQLALGIVIIIGAIWLGFYIESVNEHTFLNDCSIKYGKDNFIVYQSFSNDSECGCKWYNLCDNGCILCKEK